MVKVAVVGCGSIARRHINNLLGFRDVGDIFVYTRTRDLLNNLPADSRIKPIDSLNDGFEADFAIVANETRLHVDTAVFLAQKRINLFIEKPISHSLDKINQLKELVKDNKIKAAVAYNMRFLPAIDYIKDKVSGGDLGRLYFAQIEAASYLPSWRANTDYRQCYSADKQRGGGVALDLSHELDYMRYIFGAPSSWQIAQDKISELEIDSDDFFQGTFEYSNGFYCSLHLDYFQRIPIRRIRVVGSQAVLTADLINKQIVVERYQERVVVDSADMFDLGQTYIAELGDFMRLLWGGQSKAATLDDGAAVLEMLATAKRGSVEVA